MSTVDAGEGRRGRKQASYMKPLSRARGERSGGGREMSGDGEGGPSARSRRRDDGPRTSRVSFVRRRDSAPVHPSGEDASDDASDGSRGGEGSRSASEGEMRTPSAPPRPSSEESGRARRETRGVMDRVAPLPPWADARARRAFTLRALPNDGTHVRCHVLRKPGPFGAFPTYVLYLDGRETTVATLEDAVPILVARKRKKAKCTHYLIGDDGAERSLNETHASYVGKLKANFIGTRFKLLDSGARPRAWGLPRHLGDDSDDEEEIPQRRALAEIRYAVNVLGAGGPRSLSVSLFDSERSAPDDVPTVSHELESARPAWNASCRAYVLNFNGRVTRPSVKNFQLVCAAAQDDADVSGDDASHPRVFAQFGRVDDNLFTLDFAHPLGPLTAFAACLSAFESKFARE